MVEITKTEAEQIRRLTRAVIVRYGHGNRYAMSEEPDALQELALLRGYSDCNADGLIIPARIQMMKDITR